MAYKTKGNGKETKETREVGAKPVEMSKDAFRNASLCLDNCNRIPFSKQDLMILTDGHISLKGKADSLADRFFRDNQHLGQLPRKVTNWIRNCLDDIEKIGIERMSPVAQIPILILLDGEITVYDTKYKVDSSSLIPVLKKALENAAPYSIDRALSDRVERIEKSGISQATTMIERDGRLVDAPDKDAVISRVKARLHEVGTNGLTLGDVVKEEADKQLAEKAKALSVPIQMDAEAGKRILSWHFRNVVSQDCSDSAKSDLKSLPKNPTEAEVVAAVKAIPKDRLDDVVYRDNTTVIKIRSQLEHISIITPYRSVQDAISAKLSE